MRSLVNLTPIILVLVASGGCQQADPGPPNMMREILGALQIRDGKERDAALAIVCRDSAGEGSAPAVLMGIPRIDDAGLRDEVAEDCAVTLRDGGQKDAAVAVARLISSESRRDNLLAMLADGP